MGLLSPLLAGGLVLLQLLPSLTQGIPLQLGERLSAQTVPRQSIEFELPGTYSLGDVVYLDVSLDPSENPGVDTSSAEPLMEIEISQFSPLRSTGFVLPVANSYFSTSNLPDSFRDDVEFSGRNPNCLAFSFTKPYCATSQSSSISVYVFSARELTFTISANVERPELALGQSLPVSVQFNSPRVVWLNLSAEHVAGEVINDIKVFSASTTRAGLNVEYGSCNTVDVMGKEEALSVAQTISQVGQLNLDSKLHIPYAPGLYFLTFASLPADQQTCNDPKALTVGRSLGLSAGDYAVPVIVLTFVSLGIGLLFVLLWLLNLCLFKSYGVAQFHYQGDRHPHDAGTLATTGTLGTQGPVVGLVPAQDGTFYEMRGANVKDTLARRPGAAVGPTPDHPWPCKDLTLNELDRRGHHAQSIRGHNYLGVAVVVTLFYALVSGQVAVRQQELFNDGFYDLCAHNFLCAHRYEFIRSFNNFISNMAFLVFGLVLFGISLFFSHVYRRQVRHAFMERFGRRGNRYEIEEFLSQVNECGVKKNFFIFYTISFLIFAEGVFSAFYHLCPQPTTFQFDTTYMYCITVLLILCLFQKRHPDLIVNPIYAFGIIGIGVLFTAIGVEQYTENGFWIAFLVVEVVFFIVAYLDFYSSGRLCRRQRFHGHELKETSNVPLTTFAVLMLIVNWALMIAAVAAKPQFGQYLLGILVLNFLIYLAFYIIMKIIHDRRSANRHLVWKPIVLFIVTVGCTAAALYFFERPHSDKTEAPEISRNENSNCVLFDFYDSHDVWHFLAACALFFASLTLMYLDMDLNQVERQHIKVF